MNAYPVPASPSANVVASATALSTPLATRYPKNFPDWVRELYTAVWDESAQIFRLPTPTPEQRDVVSKTRQTFLHHLEQTPRRYPELAEALLKELAALTLVKPHSADAGLLRQEANIYSFKLALWDMPVWASLRAVRNWMTGSVTFYDEPKNRYNTRWMPDAGELRRVATRYVKDIHDRISMLDKILRERSALPKLFDPDEDLGFQQFGDCLQIGI